MSDFQAQHRPLGGGARIIRGFSRFGVLLGGTAAVLGAITTAFIALEQYNSQVARHQHATCMWRKGDLRKEIASTADERKIEIDADSDKRCAGPLYRPTVAEIRELASVRPSLAEHLPLGVGGPLLSILGGLAVFGCCWVVGWTLAGFAKT